MLTKMFKFKAITVVLIFQLLITSASLELTDLASGKNTDKETAKPLNILYLGINYLVPEPPENNPNNKLELLARNQTVLGHSVRDRKLDNSIVPDLNLWVDDFGMSGLILDCELIIQAVEDSKVVTGKVFKIEFQNYTTAGIIGPVNVKLNFSKYIGEPFDIMYGAENWASVTLVIKRTDYFTTTNLRIYCGADGKPSFVKLPYDSKITLSYYDYHKNKDNDKNNTGGFGVDILICCLIVMAVLIYLAPKKFKKI